MNNRALSAIAFIGLAAAGATVGGKVDESNKVLRAEITKWAKVIREAGIRAN